MVNRLASVLVGSLLPLALAPVAVADPEPPPLPLADAVPPDGAVASDAPSTITTPDGWILTVAARSETQVAVNPLTTALSSREYLVGGTFTGSTEGSGKTTLTGASLEAGYQIGCGITADKVKLSGSVGISSSGSTLAGLVPTGIGVPIIGQIEVTLKPGDVTNVQVGKKSVKGNRAQITLKDIHVKIDGCVGQSFLRSYAVLTTSSDSTNDVVGYYGITKTV